MKYGSGFKWAFVFGIILFLSCSDDNDPVKSGEVTECSTINSITVTTIPELSFTWSPDCLLTGWNIEPVGSGTDQWMVLFEGSNSIQPPITYGVVPDGARELHAAEVLVPGTEYNIYLFKWTGPGAQDGVVIDSISFTR